RVRPAHRPRNGSHCGARAAEPRTAQSHRRRSRGVSPTETECRRLGSGASGLAQDPNPARSLRPPTCGSQFDPFSFGPRRTYVDRDAACELLSPYVLDALDRTESETFQAHLATCPVCQEDKRLLEEVMAALAHAAPPASPAPEVRERVLASIRE